MVFTYGPWDSYILDGITICSVYIQNKAILSILIDV